MMLRAMSWFLIAVVAAIGLVAVLVNQAKSVDSVQAASADFELLVLKPNENESYVGEAQERFVYLYGKNGFSGTVSLSLEQLDDDPGTLSTSFDPATVTVSDGAWSNSVLKITGPQEGDARIKVTATGSGVTKSAGGETGCNELKVSIDEAADQALYSLSANPNHLSVTAGESAETTVTVHGDSGFNLPVRVNAQPSLTGCASGHNSFPNGPGVPSSITDSWGDGRGNGSTGEVIAYDAGTTKRQLKINTTTATPAGTYRIAVWGDSIDGEGGEGATTSFTLTVNAASASGSAADTTSSTTTDTTDTTDKSDSSDSGETDSPDDSEPSAEGQEGAQRISLSSSEVSAGDAFTVTGSGFTATTTNSEGATVPVSVTAFWQPRLVTNQGETRWDGQVTLGGVDVAEDGSVTLEVGVPDETATGRYTVLLTNNLPINSGNNEAARGTLEVVVPDDASEPPTTQLDATTAQVFNREVEQSTPQQLLAADSLIRATTDERYARPPQTVSEEPIDPLTGSGSERVADLGTSDISFGNCSISLDQSHNAAISTARAAESNCNSILATGTLDSTDNTVQETLGSLRGVLVSSDITPQTGANVVAQLAELSVEYSNTSHQDALESFRDFLISISGGISEDVGRSQVFSEMLAATNSHIDQFSGTPVESETTGNPITVTGTTLPQNYSQITISDTVGKLLATVNADGSMVDADGNPIDNLTLDQSLEYQVEATIDGETRAVTYSFTSSSDSASIWVVVNEFNNQALAKQFFASVNELIGTDLISVDDSSASEVHILSDQCLLAQHREVNQPYPNRIARWFVQPAWAQSSSQSCRAERLVHSPQEFMQKFKNIVKDLASSTTIAGQYLDWDTELSQQFLDNVQDELLQNTDAREIKQLLDDVGYELGGDTLNLENYQRFAKPICHEKTKLSGKVCWESGFADFKGFHNPGDVFTGESRFSRWAVFIMEDPKTTTNNPCGIPFPTTRHYVEYFNNVGLVTCFDSNGIEHKLKTPAPGPHTILLKADLERKRNEVLATCRQVVASATDQIPSQLEARGFDVTEVPQPDDASICSMPRFHVAGPEQRAQDYYQELVAGIGTGGGIAGIGTGGGIAGVEPGVMPVIAGIGTGGGIAKNSSGIITPANAQEVATTEDTERLEFVPTNYLSIDVQGGPLGVLVTDPAGLSTGFNPASGQDVEQSEHVSIVGNRSDQVFVTTNGVLDGEYSITLYGLADSQYTGTIQLTLGDRVVAKTIEGAISKDQTITEPVTIDFDHEVLTSTDVLEQVLAAEQRSLWQRWAGVIGGIVIIIGLVVWIRRRSRRNLLPN